MESDKKSYRSCKIFKSYEIQIIINIKPKQKHVEFMRP